METKSVNPQTTPKPESGSSRRLRAKLIIVLAPIILVCGGILILPALFIFFLWQFESTEAINYHYRKDRNAVYYYPDPDLSFFFRDKLPGADPDSFNAVSLSYGKDSDGVYYKAQLLEGADAGSFEMYGEFPNSSKLAADSKTVYYKGESLDFIDRSTWNYVANDISKDADGVYCHDELIQGIDPVTYVAHSVTPYSFDDTHVLFRCEIIDGADVDTWEFVGTTHSLSFFSKDQDHVYHASEVLPDADPATFRRYDEYSCPTCEYHARSVYGDGENFYVYGKKVSEGQLVGE